MVQVRPKPESMYRHAANALLLFCHDLYVHQKDPLTCTLHLIVCVGTSVRSSLLPNENSSFSTRQ